MIKVNDKELEVGDTVVFRCGGEAGVRTISPNTFGDKKIHFSNDKFGLEFNDDGKSDKFTSLDIIDIKKKPEPVVAVNSYYVYSKRISPIENPKAKHSASQAFGVIEIKRDVLNRKILSAVVVDNK